MFPYWGALRLIPLSFLRKLPLEAPHSKRGLEPTNGEKYVVSAHVKRLDREGPKKALKKALGDADDVARINFCGFIPREFDLLGGPVPADIDLAFVGPVGKASGQRYSV